jgi:hypothetical protein
LITLRMPPLRLNHALGGTAIFCALLAAWPWMVPPSLPTTEPRAAPSAGFLAPAFAALPPLASFSATVERPLFTPSRRPPAGAETAAGPSIESRYRLLGVVTTGPTKKAFAVDGTRHVEITEGNTLDGWSVKEIRSDRVLLTSPAGEAVLKLKPTAPEAPKPQ